jgi:dipeptidyl aminopeptidase/acylaminoacyl peptidase
VRRAFALHATLILAMACACAPPLARSAQPLSAAQALGFIRISDLHFSPDGTKLAYVAVSYRWDAQPHARVADIATASTREITPAGKSERSPQWSPAGDTLALLSNRGGATQV